MIVFDVEADGLLDQATKIHVLSYTSDGKNVVSLHDYDDMRKLLLSQTLLVGHNIVCYDIPLLEKLLGIKITAKKWDTLAMSWYLNYSRYQHGLNEYGAEFGIPKPKIDDWENLTQEEYRHRCEEDVKINWRLWKQLKGKALKIYEERKEVERIFNYLSFKMDCAYEASKSGWKVDLDRVRRNIDELEAEQSDKINKLIEAMPKKEIFRELKRPAKPFKKDGTYSVTGAKWFKILSDNNLPKDYLGVVSILSRVEDGNPNSVDQVKDWLHRLGWKPQTFKYVREDDGSLRKVEQLRVEVDGVKELCPSVLKLAKKNPAIEYLAGLSVIQHRLGIFKNFEKFGKDGWLKAEIHGLTNTLRFKHKNPLVNLPGVDKPWGEEIRGSLIAPEGCVLCGSDMVSLEDTTKRHFMNKYDPEYVKEMSEPGFDPHLDLALHAGAVTRQQVEDHRNKVKDLTSIRKDYKRANYACVYGVQAKRLSRDSGLSVSKCEELIKSYWKRNWAVEAVANDTITKKVDGELWLYNPISRFWYSLRHEKDKFSTLNQSTGVYCFDTWVMNFRKIRKQLTAQFHDEIISCIPENKIQEYEKILRSAIEKTNKMLILDIELDIDVKFGSNYAQIH